MLLKIFFSFLGLFLMVIGCSYIIIYTNLFSFGYTISEYFSHLVTRYECWYFIVGLIIEITVIFGKGKNSDKCI